MTAGRSRGHLTLVHSADHGNDLPPRWDGNPVTWEPWDDTQTTLRFHLAPDACDECGATWEPLSTSGRAGTAKDPLFLVAFRCKACKHDVVYDLEHHRSWDLDADDYDDVGSSP